MEELEGYFKGKKLQKFRAKQVFLHLHKDYVSSFDEMNTLPKELRATLAEDFVIYTVIEEKKLVSKTDRVEKYLYSLHDGEKIETVLMEYKHGSSLCISTQVGCKMGCTFCASTVAGFVRSLSAGEMLSEVYQVEKSQGEKVTNIVLMGIGEPLDNYDEVIKFLRRIIDENGRNFSVRSITLSTCGIVPKIYDLADEGMQITLAVSLHAPNDRMRKQTMPVATAFKIEEILKATDYYVEQTGRRVTYEYALIKGENDSEENAQELAKLLKGKLAHVNLIPVNKIAERDYEESTEKSANNFLNTLKRHGVNATIRRTLGSDISAACGQLRHDEIKKR